MKIKFITYILLVMFSFTSTLLPSSIYAQEDLRTETFNEIVDALNKETEEVYNEYVVIVDELQNNQESAALEFRNNLPIWRSIFRETSSVFTKYQSSNDPQIYEITNLALEANKKALLATDLYEKALNTNTDSEFDNYVNEADSHFIESSEIHFRAVDLYNDYSGVSSTLSIRNWLIFFAIISIIFSIILFIKSRKRSLLQAELIRSSVYKDLFASSLWMTGGLAITTGGYYYALETGGTYYIFYGAIAVGGWQLLKGLYHYFTEGRATLNKLATEEKHTAIKSSYEKIPSTPQQVLTKKCKNCGVDQPLNSIVCSNCGENIL